MIALFKLFTRESVLEKASNTLGKICTVTEILRPHFDCFKPLSKYKYRQVSLYPVGRQHLHHTLLLPVYFFRRSSPSQYEPIKLPVFNQFSFRFIHGSGVSIRALRQSRSQNKAEGALPPNNASQESNEVQLDESVSAEMKNISFDKLSSLFPEVQATVRQSQSEEALKLLRKLAYKVVPSRWREITDLAVLEMLPAREVLAIGQKVGLNTSSHDETVLALHELVQGLRATAFINDDDGSDSDSEEEDQDEDQSATAESTSASTSPSFTEDSETDEDASDPLAILNKMQRSHTSDSDQRQDAWKTAQPVRIVPVDPSFFTNMNEELAEESGSLDNDYEYHPTVAVDLYANRARLRSTIEKLAAKGGHRFVYRDPFQVETIALFPEAWLVELCDECGLRRTGSPEEMAQRILNAANGIYEEAVPLKELKMEEKGPERPPNRSPSFKMGEQTEHDKVHREEVKRRRLQVLAESIAMTRTMNHVVSAYDVGVWLTRARATHVTLLHVDGNASSTEWMVIGTGLSKRHLYACAEAVRHMVKEKLNALAESNKGSPPIAHPSVAGQSGNEWLAVEIGGIAVQLLTERARRYYQLEELWGSPGKMFMLETSAPTTLTLDTIGGRSDPLYKSTVKDPSVNQE